MSNKKPTMQEIEALAERYSRWAALVMALDEILKKMVVEGDGIVLAQLLLEIEQKTGKHINDVTMAEVNEALELGAL